MPSRGRQLAEVREQHRGDAAALHLVGDLERDLGAVRALAHESGVGDDPLRARR